MSTSRRGFLAGATALVMARPAVAMPALGTAPVSISFYDYNLAQAGLGGEATRKLLAEFVAAHPSVHIDPIGATPDQLNQRVQADVIAGRPPDIAQMGFGDLDFNVHNLGVKALGDIVPKAEYDAHVAGMVPAALALAAMDGKVWGLPYTISTPVLFYNAALFRAAGLDPDHPPANWDEVSQAALAIRAKTKADGFFAGMYSLPEVDWIFQALTLSNGGRVLSEDRRTLLFDAPPVIQVAEMLRAMVVSGAHADIEPPLAAPDKMSNGELGMYLQTSALQASMLRNTKPGQELRATTMPAFGTKPTYPTNSGSGLFILSNDPLKQRAAWELMQFLTGRHGYTIITSEIGYLPLRLGIVDDPAYLKPWVDAHPLIRPNLVQLQHLSPWQSFPGPNYRQIQRTLMDAVKESAFGKQAPAAIMRAAQARAARLMPTA
jgi:multiple sugar transport system substrate-binding protein